MIFCEFSGYIFSSVWGKVLITSSPIHLNYHLIYFYLLGAQSDPFKVKNPVFNLNPRFYFYSRVNSFKYCCRLLQIDSFAILIGVVAKIRCQSQEKHNLLYLLVVTTIWTFLSFYHLLYGFTTIKSTVSINYYMLHLMNFSDHCWYSYKLEKEKQSSFIQHPSSNSKLRLRRKASIIQHLRLYEYRSNSPNHPHGDSYQFWMSRGFLTCNELRIYCELWFWTMQISFSASIIPSRRIRIK